MRATRIPARLAALLAAVVVLAGCQFSGAYDLPLPGKVVGSGDGYQVTAEFNDVVAVVPRTLVMANDVPVGQVDAVRRVGWHADVVMTIRKDIVLTKDANAAVRQTSLLGEKYIALTSPEGSTVDSAGRLSNGDLIPLSRTARNPEVEEVLGALAALLDGGGVGQLKTISAELNKMMDGRQGNIRDVLGQLNGLMSTLDQQKSNIVTALDSVNQLTATLNKEQAAIGAALDSFGPALKVLNDQHQSLMAMLKALDRLGTVGTNVLNQSKDNIVADLRELAPTLTQLAAAGDSLPRGLMMMATFPFPKNAGTLAKGDYSNALFHMDFDLNKALSGALKGGDTGLPNVGQLCALYAGGSGNCAPLMNALCAVTNISQFCNPAVSLAPSGGTSGSGGSTPSNPLGGLLGGTSPSGGSSPGGILGGLPLIGGGLP